MDYSLPLEINERFHIVDSLWVERAVPYCWVPEQEYAFIPILHLEHWVLWMYSWHCYTGVGAKKLKSPIVYCDPLNNPPTVNLKALGDLAIRHISEVASDHSCIISTN